MQKGRSITFSQRINNWSGINEAEMHKMNANDILFSLQTNLALKFNYAKNLIQINGEEK